MAFANVRNTFGQIYGTSPPKAAFQVVAGRFYRVYIRSIYFDACLDTAFGCNVCEISIGNTPTTVSWRVWGYEVAWVAAGVFRHFFAKQRLLLAFVRFHGPIFETEKPFENVCTTRSLPCMLATTVRRCNAELYNCRWNCICTDVAAKVRLDKRLLES